MLAQSCARIQRVWRRRSVTPDCTGFSLKLIEDTQTAAQCKRGVPADLEVSSIACAANEAEHDAEHALHLAGALCAERAQAPAGGRACSVALVGERTLAVWRGYRLRRALQSRSLQTKIRLRHDLYLLISDVEGEAREDLPWLDVLYGGLGRLQREVLQGLELEAAPWGQARLPLQWLGWPRDLGRAREASLLACTTLQACSPPSPLRELDGSGGSGGSGPGSGRRAPEGSLSRLEPDARNREVPARAPRRRAASPSAPDWSKVKARVESWSRREPRPTPSVPGAPGMATRRALSRAASTSGLDRARARQARPARSGSLPLPKREAQVASLGERLANAIAAKAAAMSHARSHGRH